MDSYYLIDSHCAHLNGKNTLNGQPFALSKLGTNFFMAVTDFSKAFASTGTILKKWNRSSYCVRTMRTSVGGFCQLFDKFK